MRTSIARSLTLAALAACPLPLLAATPSAGTLTDSSGPVSSRGGKSLFRWVRARVL